MTHTPPNDSLKQPDPRKFVDSITTDNTAEPTPEMSKKRLAHLKLYGDNEAVWNYKEIQECVAEIERLRASLQEMQAAIQSRHDYGPASPGEQEAAWIQYCQRSGWNPKEHPAAKNAYVEGFCDGDSFSEGDEGRAVLREENAKLQAERNAWEETAAQYCRNADFWCTEKEKAEARPHHVTGNPPGDAHQSRGASPRDDQN